MIIDGRQKRITRFFESLVTTLGWLYVVSFLTQVILSLLLWYFNVSVFVNELLLFPHLLDTIRVFGITLAIAVCSFMVLYLWGKYNFNKYGKLNRRQFPPKVEAQDVSNYFGISIEKIEKYQNSKWVELDKTIV